VENLMQDFKYALRVLRKNFGFAGAAILLLALGIGTNTAIFGLMNALVLQNLPVHDPSGLVIVGDPTQVHYRGVNTPPRADVFSYKLYNDLRDGNSVFSAMLASAEVQRVRVARPGESRGSIVVDQALGVLVSGNYFSVLGVNTFRGRTITPADDEELGTHPVAVISYGFWKEKLGGDAAIVGSTMLFNNYPFTIVGVTTPGFYGDTVGDQQDIWFPVSMQHQLLPSRELLKDYRNSWFHIMARLRPSITLPQAKANINLVFQRLLDGPLGKDTLFTDKESLRRLQVEVSEGGRGFSQVRGQYKQPLWLLMGIVGVVLLIACANLANLLLARALARRREVAVRIAIGASRSRIARQFLIESLVLSCAGGAIGLLIANWASAVLLQMSGTVGTEVHLNGHVLLFTTSISVFTGLLFGVAPAVRAVDLSVAETLKTRSEGQGSGISVNPGDWNWGKILVVSQVALSVAVLFAAGLMVRTMRNLHQVELRFDDSNMLLARVDPISAGYTTPQKRAEIAEQLADRFSSLPGVLGVTFGQNGLFFGDWALDEIKIDGYIPKKSDDWNAATDRIGPNYFKVLRVPILRGREVTTQDTATAPKVTVINDSMAHFYFGDRDPIGRTLWITDGDKPESYQIVGVASDFRSQSLRGAPLPTFYVPITQSPEAVGSLNFMIKTAGNPEALIETVHKSIRSFDSNLPILAIRGLSDRLDENMRSEILLARLSGFFGVFALFLACIGLYAIISYMVARKTRAIGVRMALGALPQDIFWMVLREAMFLVIVGVGIGIPVSMVGGNLISSLLYGLKTSDPRAMAMVIALLMIVSAAATYVPARRATKINPIMALRDE